MKKRIIKVVSKTEALNRIRHYLYANGAENYLAPRDDKSKVPEYEVRLGWLCRGANHDRKIGTPVFVCDFDGIFANGNRAKGKLFAKVFAEQDYRLVGFVLQGSGDIAFEEIEPGTEFSMGSRECYLVEKFRYEKNGTVVPIDGL